MLSIAQQLAKEATDAATFRGHTLGAWEWRHTARRTTGLATCRHCGFIAAVNTNPAPNDIDISGGAVAMSCQE